MNLFCSHHDDGHSLCWTLYSFVRMCSLNRILWIVIFLYLAFCNEAKHFMVRTMTECNEVKDKTEERNFLQRKKNFVLLPTLHSTANTNTNLHEVFQIGIQAIDAICYLALLLHSQLYRMIPLKWEKTAFKCQFIFMYTKNRLQR